MSNKKQTGFYIFISLVLCVSVALTGLTYYSQKKTSDAIRQMMGAVEDVNREDDVTIAGRYVIKSTLPISEAYISGDTSALSDSDKETLDMAKEVLDEIIEPNMSDYEKEKAVYIWLTSKLSNNTSILTVIPETNNENDNPHDVLKYHSAVCVGYATTFRLFMQMLNIECKVVHSSDLTHTWDLVKLDDGWYHTDCYFDNPNSTFRNFNMDDNHCVLSHDWTREYFPAAKGQKYNYIFSISDKLDSIYDVPQWLTKAVIDKKPVISCMFNKKITPETEKDAQYLVNQLCDAMNGYETFSVSYEWMQNDNKEYVLGFYIDTNTDNYEPDETTKEKLDKAVMNAVEEFNEKIAVG